MKIFKLCILFLFLSLGAVAQKESIKWMTIEEALKASETSPRKILIDIYTDWCGWCKVMDRETFGDSATAAYINKNYYAVKMNAETQPEFLYKGQVFRLLSANGKTINQFVLAITDSRPSYPSIAYLDESASLLTVIPGFKKPKDLLPILQYLKEDKFKTMKFDEYMIEQSDKTDR